MIVILDRKEKIRESIEAPLVINTSVEIKIPRSNQMTEKKFKCTCCGASYNTQKSNFSKSASLLYQSNDGYINICNSCRDKYYYQLVDLYDGNEEKAIEHMCREFGWVYHIDALHASRQISADRSRISHYLAKKNLGQTAAVGSTYINTLKHNFLNRQEEIIDTVEKLEDSDVTVSKESVERWGTGFPEEYYRQLDEHYKMLKKANPNCDSNQEIFIKSLCQLNWLQSTALKDGDIKDYVSANAEYTKTFKQAGLTTIQDSDKNADDCWGMFMEQISQYTPEEYYKDKKLYEDFDNIGSTFDRFVLRPLKNLLCKTSERDEEYNVEGTINE